jgi:hypothetical protein
MATVTTRPVRRKLGVEPRGLDLTPIVSQAYTEAEAQEISAFFQQQRAANDRLPAIVALREAVARRQHPDLSS